MSSLVSIAHYRWSLPILAELHSSRGATFVTLAHRLGLGRESLTRTLTALIDSGLVARNPGYGHPLRPEYVLSSDGAVVAPECAQLLQALRRLGHENVALKKWSLPVVLGLSGRAPKRFSELRASLPGITGRALALALKDLAGVGLVERTVTDDFPPATVYRLSRRARGLAPILMRLDRPEAAPRRTGTAPRPARRT